MHTDTNMISTYLVKQDCQLTDELTGNLWYVHNSGDKAIDIEQHGLFLVHTTYPEGANPDNFAHYDMDTFEAWGQLAQSYDAPYEDKLRSFREAGVLWLGNGPQATATFSGV